MITRSIMSSVLRVGEFCVYWCDPPRRTSYDGAGERRKSSRDGWGGAGGNDGGNLLMLLRLMLMLTSRW